SRRRHTRLSRDWSSDVCSSDLNAQELFTELARDDARGQELAAEAEQRWAGAQESNAKVKGWPDEKWQAVQREGAEATERVAELKIGRAPCRERSRNLALEVRGD